MPKDKRINETVKVSLVALRTLSKTSGSARPIADLEIRELSKGPEPTDSQVSIGFGSAVAKADAIKVLRMVLEKIEADGLPNLVLTMDKRAAGRFVNVAKSSKLLATLPDEVRQNVRMMLHSDL
jgi:hypothetical protein